MVAAVVILSPQMAAKQPLWPYTHFTSGSPGIIIGWPESIKRVFLSIFKIIKYLLWFDSLLPVPGLIWNLGIPELN